MNTINKNTRITPEKITFLGPNKVFIFGSNSMGAHLSGAAKLAKDKFGAEEGVGYGVTGKCYAINTMSGLKEIQKQIPDFITYASNNPQKTFLVTAIGTGIAGYSADEIAPMFADAVYIKNIHLPQSFWDVILNKN